MSSVKKKATKNMLRKTVRKKCAIFKKWLEKTAHEKNTVYKKQHAPKKTIKNTIYKKNQIEKNHIQREKKLFSKKGSKKRFKKTV